MPFTFTADADVVKRECSLDGGAYAICSSGWSGITAATPDGTRSYRVKVTDDVGNVAESAVRTTVVDRTLPGLAFTDGPSEGQQVVTRNASITFSLVEARVASVKCKLDAAAWAVCSPGTAVELIGLTDGPHVLSVQAVDTAGNTRTINRSFGVQVPSTGRRHHRRAAAAPRLAATRPPAAAHHAPAAATTATGGGTTTGGGHDQDRRRPAAGGVRAALHAQLRLCRRGHDVHEPRRQRPPEDGEGGRRLQGLRLRGQEQGAQALRRQAERAQGAQEAQAQGGRDARDHGHAATAARRRSRSS